MDDSVPEHLDAPSSSSRELPSEPRAKVIPGKHSIFTHFLKDRNCNSCLRTNITWAPRSKRTGTVVPIMENFGDLITADHKVLSEGCESRHNHRYAVVVQDLATQWIQSYLCKTKTSQETQKSLQKFLEATCKPKVVYTDSSLEFGKACEDLSRNHFTSTPHLVLKSCQKNWRRWTHLNSTHQGSNAKELLTPLKGEHLTLPTADGTVEISGEDDDLRTSTLIGDSPDRGEEQDNLRGKSDGSSSTSRQDSSWYDGEAKNDFWSISGDFIYRHHVEPRVNCTCRLKNPSLFH